MNFKIRPKKRGPKPSSKDSLAGNGVNKIASANNKSHVNNEIIKNMVKQNLNTVQPCNSRKNLNTVQPCNSNQNPNTVQPCNSTSIITHNNANVNIESNTSIMETICSSDEDFLGYPDNIIPNVNTKNQFSVLMEDQTKINETPTTNRAMRYCPPITIKHVNNSKVREILSKVNIPANKCRIKLTSMGIRVQCLDSNHHKLLRNFLTNENIEFFSYQLPEERTSNFTLSGLYAMDIAELKTELINLGLKTLIDIKKLGIRNKRYDDHTIYLIKIKRGTTTINELKKIKSIFYTMVKWDYYRKNKNGPNQCSRCLNYGHAAANCNLKIRCAYCGNHHNKEDCNLLIQSDINELGNNITPKCCNCDGDHKATFINCPKKMTTYLIKNTNQ